MIGAASVATSAPDSYTILFGAASEMAINASLFKNMPYDPRTGFEPVSLIEFNTWVGVAAPKGTPQDVIARHRSALSTALAASDVQAALRDQGAVRARSRDRACARRGCRSCAAKPGFFWLPGECVDGAPTIVRPGSPAVS